MEVRRTVSAICDELIRLRPRLHLATAIGRWIPDLVGTRTRAALLRMAGVCVGTGTVFGGGIRVEGTGPVSRSLTIGARCWINTGCYFDVSAPIGIGDDVAIGQEVLVITQTHHLGPQQRRAGQRTSAAVLIGDGSWIGARAVILPGVSVGRGAVVAAGAVVRRDVPPDTLVAGIPAREVKRLPTDEPAPESDGL